MNQLFEIDLHDYDGCTKVFRRPSARAVILNGNTIALVYSENEGYYKFPGGGIRDEEDKMLALIREVKEEVGLTVIPGSIREFGSVMRRQRSNYDTETIFEQENFYYFCSTDLSVSEQELDDYEEGAGFTLRYVGIDEAIKANSEYRSEDFFDEIMILREKMVLEVIKEMLH